MSKASTTRFPASKAGYSRDFRVRAATPGPFFLTEYTFPGCCAARRPCGVVRCWSEVHRFGYAWVPALRCIVKNAAPRPGHESSPHPHRVRGGAVAPDQIGHIKPGDRA